VRIEENGTRLLLKRIITHYYKKVNSVNHDLSFHHATTKF
jgi:hypothetical protein